MNEHVLAAVDRLNKAISLLAVEPLYGPLHHKISSLSLRAYLRRVFRPRSKPSRFRSSFGEHHQSDAKRAAGRIRFGRISIQVKVAAPRPDYKPTRRPAFGLLALKAE